MTGVQTCALPIYPELDAVRTRQAAGDFFVRFGQYGDNKYSLELRLCEFLDDVRKRNFKNNTIAIVSHGTVISFMKRILELQPSHLKKGGFEEFSDIDFSKLDEHKDKLAAVKNKLIANRMKLIRRIQSNICRVNRGCSRWFLFGTRFVPSVLLPFSS